jgi:uncharacterized membrane protein|tara:strand:- start:227 stop:622 length:396 start_codon:yes stop_codon:yes gene_type:complete
MKCVYCEKSLSAAEIPNGYHNSCIQKYELDDLNLFTEISSDELESSTDVNSGLANTFSNLNSLLFIVTIFVNILLLTLGWVAYGPMAIVFAGLLTLYAFMFHGAAAVIIKILDTAKEISHTAQKISQKLDK